MTREEARRILRAYIWKGELDEARNMAITALEQQPCEDCISREEVIKHITSVDGLEGFENSNVFAKHYLDMVKGMPSVQPKAKVGHWIESHIPHEKYVCSECGGACWYYDYEGDVAKSRYCPNCGAKMESEDKHGK